MAQITAHTDRAAGSAPPARHRHPVISAPNLVLLAVVICALVVRWLLVDIETNDFRSFLDPWYRHLQTAGLAGLADVNSNYNTPYLVLLALVGYLPVPELVAIKSISVVFDLLLAFFAFRLVRAVRPDARWLPVTGTGLVLLLPTVILNGSAWAQCDAIYASFCLGSLYFLIKRRAWLACAMFGLAFAFKLQAVFLLPVLLGVLVINRLRWRALIAVPAVFFAALVPALIAGRSLVSQLLVYPAQMGLTSSTGGGGAAGQLGGRGSGGGFGGGGGRPSGGGPGGGPGGGFSGGGGADVGSGHAFTQNAPTWYSWLPADASDVWKYVGLGLAAAVAVGFAIILIRRRRALAPADILLVAAASTLIIPLLLPEMHERYFYLAEVLTVVAIMVGGRAWIGPAAAIQIASVSTYLAYLTNTSSLPLGLAALIALAGAVTAGVLLVRRLTPPDRTLPASSSDRRRREILTPAP